MKAALVINLDTKLLTPSRRVTLRQLLGGILVTIPGTAYTLSAANNGQVLRFTSNDPVVLTVPAGLGAGFSCLALQRGDGAVTPTAGAGVTVDPSRQGYTKTAGAGAFLGLYADAADTFILFGDGA
jgi:hypothetical protein